MDQSQTSSDNWFKDGMHNNHFPFDDIVAIFYYQLFIVYDLNCLKMIQYFSGAEPVCKRMKHKDTAERITRICQKFNTQTFDKYII